MESFVNPGHTRESIGGWRRLGIAMAALSGVTVTPFAAAATLVPIDPMYVLLFGGGAPSADPVRPASVDGRKWQVATHSLTTLVDDPARPSVSADDLAFRPRLVSALGSMASLQQATLADETGPRSQDVYAQRTVVGNSVGGVHLIGGIKIGVLGGESLAAMGAGHGSLINTAQLASAATGMLVGPMLGIAGDGQLRQHRVRGVFQQSKLYGNAQVTRSVAGGDGIDGLRSGVESYVERRDLNVSVSELGLKYQYELNDRVALGMGAMASVWWNLPDAAGTAGSGGDPEVFVGGMGTLEMKF